MINGVKKSIYIVEDEPDIRETLAYNLTQEGFIVSQFPDAELCLNKLNQRKPDLLILDLMLPGMSGLELCKIIKSDRGVTTKQASSSVYIIPSTYTVENLGLLTHLTKVKNYGKD